MFAPMSESMRPLRSQRVGNGLRLKLDPLAVRQRILKKKIELQRTQRAFDQRNVRNRTEYWQIGPKEVDLFSWLSDQVTLPEDCAVLTATDERMFVGFQMMYASLRYRHNVPVFVVDLGMAGFQQSWVDDLGIKRIPYTDLDLAVKGPNWQTWNKPFYFKAVPEKYQRILWIDADCVVTGHLDEAFETLQERPFITRDTVSSRTCSPQKALRSLQNHPDLYDLLEVKKNWSGDVLINAGVVGFDRERDREILDEWEYCVFEASQTPRIRKLIRLFDQGALIWAMEKVGHVDVVEDAIWNDASLSKGHVNNIDYFKSGVATSASKIVHFAGTENKPWDGWKTGRLDFVPYPDTGSHKDIRFYFFCWDKEPIAHVKECDYLKRLHIQSITTKFLMLSGQYRLFLRDHFDDLMDRDYIGFANPWWIDKNKVLVDKLSLRQLNPEDVLTSNVIEKGWHQKMEKEFPGYLGILKELQSITGMSFEDKATIDSNAVFAHRDVIHDWRRVWKMVYLYLYNNYGQRLVPSSYTQDANWLLRIPSMITMLYFAHNGEKYNFRKFE